MAQNWKDQENWSPNGKTNMSPGPYNTDAPSGRAAERVTPGTNPHSRGPKPETKEAAEALHKRHLGGPIPTGRGARGDDDYDGV